MLQPHENRKSSYYFCRYAFCNLCILPVLRLTQNSVAHFPILSFSAAIGKNLLLVVLYKLTFNSGTVFLVAVTHHISGCCVLDVFSWSGFCSQELLPVSLLLTPDSYALLNDGDTFWDMRR
jgi:hypothetical protein